MFGENGQFELRLFTRDKEGITILYVDKSKLFLERVKETWPRVENINQ